MPFTASHVMAVLPGVRWHRRLHLDPTCLVIGSMAPDFEYFARGELVGRFGHTFVGIAGWGIPVTLLLAALYHYLVKWPALLAAPAAASRVFAHPWQARWNLAAIGSVVLSAALGDLTHLLWDGLTHANGIFVRYFPALETRCSVPVLGEMVLHRILQHASTVVGLVAVTWFVVRRIRRAPASPAVPIGRARARLTFAICIAAGTSLTLYRLWRMHVGDPGSLIAGTISGVLAGTIVASAILYAAGRRYRQALEDNPPR